MSESLKTDEHAEIELLLPWYVNGTLDDVDRKRVVDHTADCVQCQSEIALCESMRSAVTHKSPASITPQPDSNALLRALDERQAKPVMQLRWMNALAAAAVVATIVAVSMIVENAERAGHIPIDFETATSDQQSPGMGAIINITFDSASSQEERREVLREYGAIFRTETPIADSIEINVKTPASSLQDLESYRASIAAEKTVHSVRLMAISVPQEELK